MSKINQKLLTEIFRQKELMGIKQILSEGVGLNSIKDFFNISDIDQTYTKIFDDVMEEIKSTNPGLIQDIETNFRMNDVSFSSLKNSPIRRTVNFSQNSAILENLLYDLTKSLTKVIYSGKNPAYEKLADEIIEESLKGLTTNKQAYDIMVNLAISGERKKLEEYISGWGSYFDSEIINYIRNVKFKENPWYNKLYEQIRKKFGEGWVLTVKGWDKIKDFSLYLKELTKKNSVLEGIFTTFPVSPISKLMGIDYSKHMASPAELKRDLDEIFGRIVSRLESGVDTDITKEQRELIAKFNEFLSKRNESHKIIFTEWMNKWKQDPRLSRLFNEKDINGNPEPFYFKNGFKDEKFIQIMDQFEKANGTDITSIRKTYNKIDQSIKMLKNIGGIVKLHKVFGLQYWINFWETSQRLFGTLLFWTPTTLKELNYNRKVLGDKRWVGLGVGQKLVTSGIMLPALLTVYKTFGSYVQDYVNTKRKAEAKENETPKLMKWWDLDDDEWSEVMNDKPGWEGFRQLVWDNFKDFSIASFENLGSKPAAWSLAAWAFINYEPSDIKASDFKSQLKSVQQNGKTVVDTMMQMAQQDPEIKKVVDSMNIQSYDTLVQKIDSTLQNIEY
jgi:hypothetical protein